MPRNNYHQLFLLYNIKTLNYDFLFYLQQYGILEDSVLLGLLFCEIGSRKKIFPDLHIEALTDFDEILLSAEEQDNPKFFQIGIEIIRKCKE